jgi:DNA-binding CsgD family transcriptional regulator
MQSTELLRVAKELRLMTSVSTSLAGLLRGLVHNVLAEHGAVAAFVGILLKDSRFMVLESYGYNPEVAVRGSLYSVWDKSAVNDALRTGEIKIYKSRKDYLVDYPGNARMDLPGDGFVAIPVWIESAPFGAIGVALSPGAVPESSPEKNSVWELTRLFFEIQNDRPVWHQELERDWASVRDSLLNPDLNSTNLVLSSDLPIKLTHRQIQILELIREGLTNRQIGYRLRVSDSTVGRESVQIYKLLGAGSRQEAVQIAEANGLIKPEDDQGNLTTVAG